MGKEMVMAKFNIVEKRHKPSPGPLGTSTVPDVRTGNNAPGFSYEDKSALFLLGVNSMFGQDKHYEKAAQADQRFVGLVRKVTQVDPVWMLGFITWLRQSGNMRSSAVVASVEAALVAKQDLQPGAQLGLARQLAQAGIGRADEIGEALGYFMSTYKGKQVPKPIKRGLADACVKLFNEYTALKYGSVNSDKKAFTPARILNLLHPKSDKPWQQDLFGYLVAREYGEVEIPESLLTLQTRKELMALPVAERRNLLSHGQVAQQLKAAGMTWESLAGWLQGPMDKHAWNAIIPSMGYFALLRNLRNFDEAGISPERAKYVQDYLADPERVRKSKLFPFRFLAAYREVNNLRWASALSAALSASLVNIPTLPGRTLVLVDTSGSMDVPFSEHSSMKRWDAAALFGIALGLANPGQVDVISYSNNARVFPLRAGADVLGEWQRWVSERYNLNGGTNTAGTLQAAYRGHDRVVILTDEQANFHGYGNYGVGGAMPQDKHLFSFNLAGYRQGHAPTGKFRHSFGGLTDACFPLISQVEQAHSGQWPWENRD
jgi:hypothetical protein